MTIRRRRRSNDGFREESEQNEEDESKPDCDMNPPPSFSSFPSITSRREFLWRLGGGLGGVALAQLLAGERLLADASRFTLHASRRLPHHPARAKRVIQLFMNGGASQMDLFDYKPELVKRHGQKFDPGTGERVEAATSEPGQVLKPVFEFKQHGQCGRWMSSLVPNLATCVDDMAFLMAMTSRTNVHGPGSYLMNTGFLLPGFPCFGAWVSYALGCGRTTCRRSSCCRTRAGCPTIKGNFSAGFLPVTYQGPSSTQAPANRSLICARRLRQNTSRPKPIAKGWLLRKWNGAHLAANDADTGSKRGFAPTSSRQRCVERAGGIRPERRK
jgi:hypothetical protein